MTNIDIDAAIKLAVNKTKSLLFSHFRLREWIALAFASILASQNGAALINYNGAVPGGADKLGEGILSSLQAVLTSPWLLPIILGCILLLWLSCTFRFIYTDMVVRGSCEIRRPFAEYKQSGLSFFEWLIAFGIVFAVGLGILVILPIFLASVRLISSPALNTGLIVIGIIFGVILLILAGVINVFASDFVLTGMYIRKVGVLESWREIIPIIRNNLLSCLFYILVLIGIWFGIMIYSIVALMLSLIVMAIPAVLLVLIAFFSTGGFQGSMQDLHLPIYIIIMGILLSLVWYLLLGCIMQPAMAFRRLFAIAVLGQLNPSLDALKKSEVTEATSSQDDSDTVMST